MELLIDVVGYLGSLLFVVGSAVYVRIGKGSISTKYRRGDNE